MIKTMERGEFFKLKVNDQVTWQSIIWKVLWVEIVEKSWFGKPKRIAIQLVDPLGEVRAIDSRNDLGIIDILTKLEELDNG